MVLELLEPAERFFSLDNEYIKSPSFTSHAVLVKGGLVRVFKFPALIGREKECNIILPWQSVSRKHAQINEKKKWFKGKKYFISDVGSKYGTVIIRGKEEITVSKEKIELKNKDRIVFGSSVTLEVLI